MTTLDSRMPRPAARWRTFMYLVGEMMEIVLETIWLLISAGIVASAATVVMFVLHAHMAGFPPELLTSRQFALYVSTTAGALTSAILSLYMVIWVLVGLHRAFSRTPDTWRRKGQQPSTDLPM